MQPPPVQPQSFNPGPVQKQKNTVLWIVLGAIGVGCCGAVVIGGAILFPVLVQAKDAAKKTACLSNLKRTSIGILIYTADYDDFTPPPANWMDGIKPYVKSEDPFHCPALISGAGDKSSYGYAYNKEVSVKRTLKISSPETTPLVFETVLKGRNAASGIETLPVDGRHQKKNGIAYLDGSARMGSFFP